MSIFRNGIVFSKPQGGLLLPWHYPLEISKPPRMFDLRKSYTRTRMRDWKKQYMGKKIIIILHVRQRYPRWII